ncbi:MAG: NAD-dependent epimerase/dehydratase family protein [Phycisphaerales bacterium]
MADWSREHVLVTGGHGFLGSWVVRALQARGVQPEHLCAPRSSECNLLDGQATGALFGGGMPRFSLVIHCAGRVGGLALNRAHPAKMFYENLRMTMNVIEAARACASPPFGDGRRLPKLVVIGSMTSYPANAPLPYREESLFQGLPDRDIASYGLAKLAGLAMLRAYAIESGLRSAYPVLVNLYGPGDNIDDPLVAHVAGALMKRFVDATDRKEREVVCWGTGAPTRDFLYVEDAAEGVVRAAEALLDDSGTPEPLVVNLASGREVSIRSLAETIARLAGFSGRITWDASKGDGVSRRCLDVQRGRERLDWSARTDLETGLRRTIEWYRRRKV